MDLVAVAVLDSLPAQRPDVRTRSTRRGSPSESPTDGGPADDCPGTAN
ncbi:hypothetical protein HSB1_22180 [Halogranum salarium B-1]|uniref:Uncharacterized protein n=1 Tax=Halogranum salarium B-1 TaxID=1210908 RepID=J2ZH80_9EURY|nr:hypothetical protein HSB1_22180 [Halogranum salarium B-1]